jgi:predicted nucleotidyltransferase
MTPNETLPPDINERLATIGEAIAAASRDVVFAYVFGSSETARRTPRSDVDLAIHATDTADPSTFA